MMKRIEIKVYGATHEEAAENLLAALSKLEVPRLEDGAIPEHTATFGLEDEHGMFARATIEYES